MELGGGKLGDRPQLDRNLPREHLRTDEFLRERVNETMRHGQGSWESLSSPWPERAWAGGKAQPMRGMYPSEPEPERVSHSGSGEGVPSGT